MLESRKPSFSIVICTYNRDEYLERTLKSLNKLKYDFFEVVVVNGPSTDRTEQVINRYQDKIKIVKNPVANLSISRNLGIKNSCGDIIAFLDDDAIPEENWLDQISELYVNKKNIGGAGGRVYGPGGDHFQFHNGVINVWGEADPKRDLPGEYIAKLSHNYNILMGVNSTFLKSHLIEIGGFDEYYEYYHDESDVCVRLAKAGYPIHHHQEAFVHHEFAKSHIRTSIYHLNWYPIVKNSVYFGIKNSKNIHGIIKRLVMPLGMAFKRIKDFKQWYRDGNITKSNYSSFKKMWFKGAYRGFVDGFFSRRKINRNLHSINDFLKFEKEQEEDTNNVKLTSSNQNIEVANRKFGICLLSKYYPPYGVGGVATYVKELAEGFSKQGHPVYVITSGLPQKELIIKGVSLINSDSYIVNDDLFAFIPNDIMPVTKRNLQYSWKVSLIVESLFDRGLISILETPLWDYEGLCASRIEGLKTIVRLETPLKLAAKTQNWEWNKDFELSSLLEKELIQKAHKVITISRDIQNQIGALYNIEWAQMQVKHIPLGIIDVEYNTSGSNHDDEKIEILFIGRLERRKGIDILLEAIKIVLRKHKNVKVIIAGNDKIPFSKGKTIKELFMNENPGIMDCVSFLGEIGEAEKNILLRNCDIFVAPSRYESFGLVFLEAMQLSKPVIGTDVGGISEIVDNGLNGILVKPEDCDALSLAISSLLSNKLKREEIGKNARIKYEQKFKTEKMIENTLGFYK